MKNYNRAYNRHKQHVKFLRRVNNWFSFDGNDYEEKQKALTGKGYTFLRSMSKPCNCSMCQYYKYKRLTKSEVKKIVDKCAE